MLDIKQGEFDDDAACQMEMMSQVGNKGCPLGDNASEISASKSKPKQKKDRQTNLGLIIH